MSPAVTPPPAPTLSPFDPQRPCSVCQSRGAVPDYPSPICAICRETGSRFPIPMAMRVVLAAVIVTTLYGMMRIPAAMRPALQVERAHLAEQRGDYKQALTLDESVLTHFPKDGDALSDLAVSAGRLGDLKTRDEALQKLRKLAANDSNQQDALDAAIAQLKLPR